MGTAIFATRKSSHVVVVAKFGFTLESQAVPVSCFLDQRRVGDNFYTLLETLIV